MFLGGLVQRSSCRSTTRTTCSTQWVAVFADSSHFRSKVAIARSRARSEPEYGCLEARLRVFLTGVQNDRQIVVLIDENGDRTSGYLVSSQGLSSRISSNVGIREDKQADSYRESPELVMSVCSVYYAISILLQASTVPILSGCTVGSSNCLPSPAGKPDMAFQQADEFSKLLGQFLATGLDITMLWPFVGYTAFVAGGVLMTLVPETNKLTGPNSQWTQAPQSVSDQVATVQTVLEVLGIYWVPLRSLALQLKEVVDHGEFRDVKPVTLPVYPWGLSCGDHSDHGQNPATIPFSRLGSSQSTHQAQNLSPISNVQVVEDPDSCRACDQPGNAHSQQEPQLQVAGTAGSSLYHPSDITYDFDMEELAANNGAGNNPIETDWWCAMPTDQIMGFSAETI
ncbi:fumarylacetoacetate hydrolase [Apiospora arundinis]|uniref:Fumarylacetoacetate hydrolase n=1 Tax=Apiospora arundinis TaxID=335852 RepID=A0ABR2HLF7_9PEZI